MLAELARPYDALLGRKPGSESLHDLGDDEKSEGIPGLVVYRFYGPLIFANVNFFMERLQGFIDAEKHPVRQVVIDSTAMPSIDYTAVEKLRPFLEKLAAQGIELASAEAPYPLRELKLASELEDLFPEKLTFSKVSDAVAAFKARTDFPAHEPVE